MPVCGFVGLCGFLPAPSRESGIVRSSCLHMRGGKITLRNQQTLTARMGSTPFGHSRSPAPPRLARTHASRRTPNQHAKSYRSATSRPQRFPGGFPTHRAAGSSTVPRPLHNRRSRMLRSTEEDRALAAGFVDSLPFSTRIARAVDEAELSRRLTAFLREAGEHPDIQPRVMARVREVLADAL